MIFLTEDGIHAAKEDQCYNCLHSFKCPLLVHLVSDIVYMEEPFSVLDCSMYERPHLSVVEDGE